MYGYDRDGTSHYPLVDDEGKLILAPGGGYYADAALNGRLFCAANQTATTTNTTKDTAFAGLGLCNPTGSGKLLVVQEFSYAVTAQITAEALLALATTTESGFAASITPRCCRYGYAASVAIVDAAATVVAPVLERIIGQIVSGLDTTTYGGMVPNVTKLNGSIVLAPGRALVTDTTVPVGAVMQFSYLWEEVDI